MSTTEVEPEARDSIDDEEVVDLPVVGRLTPWRLGVLVAAITFLAGAVGYWVGTADEDTPARDSVEVTFLYDMIAHHEQALTMSNAELISGSEPRVQVFAREILLAQSYEMGLMEQRLAEWGFARQEGESHEGMPGMASDAELEQFETTSGPETDALFIVLMQDHHAGGVVMADAAAENADDEFVRDIATRMARNQRIEIEELEQVRTTLGLSATPPGYQPDEATHH